MIVEILIDSYTWLDIDFQIKNEIHLSVRSEKR